MTSLCSVIITVCGPSSNTYFETQGNLNPSSWDTRAHILAQSTQPLTPFGPRATFCVDKLV